MPAEGTINGAIAERLREAAQVLEGQGANPFRVAAYRRAAETVEQTPADLGRLVEEGGVEALEALPAIGRGIAGAILEMLRTGRWVQLERWRGALDPVALFQTVPGVGPILARRIHDELQIDSLPGLELAAWDGRLRRVRGVGARRAAAIRATLAATLGRVHARRAGASAPGPDVAVILDIDREYRERAAAGDLPRIAPRRFNPTGEAWLPVMHAERGRWHFTALYSNTARAHELGRERDWVVVYSYDDRHEEGQHTVVTESRGSLAGLRVVRGRERECREHYERGGRA